MLSWKRLNLEVVYHSGYLQVIKFSPAAKPEYSTVYPGDRIIALDDIPIEKAVTSYSNLAQKDVKIILYNSQITSSEFLLPEEPQSHSLEDGQNFLLWSVKGTTLTIDKSQRNLRSPSNQSLTSNQDCKPILVCQQKVDSNSEPDSSQDSVVKLTLNTISTQNIEPLLILVLLATSFSFIATGLFLYILRPGTPITTVYTGLTNLVALEIVTSNSQFYHFGDLEKVSLALSSTLIGVLFFHFVLLFPNDSKLNKRALYIFLLPTYLISLTILSLRLFATFAPLPRRNTIVEPLIRQTDYLFSVIVLIATLIILIVKFVKSKGQERLRLNLAVFSISFSIIPPLIVLTGYLLFGLLKPLVTNSFAIFFLPAILVPPAFIYAVLKNQLLGVSLVVRRFVVHLILSSFILLAYIVTSALLTTVLPLWKDLSQGTMLISLGLAALTILLYQLRSRVQKLVDKSFKVDQLDYAFLTHHWNNQLARLTELDVIFHRVVNDLPADYHYRNAVLLICHSKVLQLLGDGLTGGNTEYSSLKSSNGSKNDFLKRHEANTTQTVLPTLLITPKNRTIDPGNLIASQSNSGKDSTINLTELNIGFSDEFWNFLENHNYILVHDNTLPNLIKQSFSSLEFLESEVALLLRVGDECYGLLLLGQKASDLFPTKEELEHLAVTANQIAVSFHNSVLLSQTIRLAQTELKLRRIFELTINHEQRTREEERAKLAEALHGDILQDLSLLRRGFDSSENNSIGEAGKNNQDTERSHQLLGQVIDKLRNLTFDLIPLRLEKSLFNELERLFQNYERQHPTINFRFSLEGEEKLFERLLSKELKVSLYRVIQEAVSNAIKHGQARQIEVTIDFNETLGVEETDTETATSGNYLLEIKIIDDGKGFDPNLLQNINELVENQHFGLSAMTRRIEEYSGEISFYSTPENGTQVSISLLVSASMTADPKFDFDELLQKFNQITK